MKNKFKRSICLFLCLSVLLTACANTNPGSSTVSGDSSTTVSADQSNADSAGEATDPDNDPTNTPGDSSDPDNDPTHSGGDSTGSGSDQSASANDPSGSGNNSSGEPTASTGTGNDSSDKTTDASDSTTSRQPDDTDSPTTSVDKTTANHSGDPQIYIIDVGEDALPFSEEEIFSQLFDLNNRIDIDIQMSNAELQKMQQDYNDYKNRGGKSPIYRLATVTITITLEPDVYIYRIDEVGVRMKGNTSRTDFYDSSNGIYNLIHLKLDFQETFDDADYYGNDAKVWSDKDARKERKNRTFATLEKLDLRWNRCNDSTYIKELYSFDMFRDFGVLAPHVNLASVDWSGNHMGVFTINEPVDEVFLEKYLSEEALGGDLYKCGWTNQGASFTNTGSIGIEDEDAGQFYCYDLKTNKKTSDHSSLTNLIDRLNSSKVTKTTFSELLDVENFLYFAAVSYFIGNPDDMRNNYNNCYIYFLENSGKMVFIPYDYDRSWGVTVHYNPSHTAMTDDNPFSTFREGVDRNSSENDRRQQNPIYIYSVDAGGHYVAEFAEILKEVAASKWLKESTFESYFNTVKANYSDSVTPSKNFHNAGGRDFSFDLYRTSSVSANDNVSFRDYVKAKLKYYNQYMGNLDEYLSASQTVNSTHYIRGDFNNWNIEDSYKMKYDEATNISSFRVSKSGTIKLKVFDNRISEWYGTESLSEENTVECETDGHGNIILPGGSYIVYFDHETETITLVKE